MSNELERNTAMKEALDLICDTIKRQLSKISGLFIFLKRRTEMKQFKRQIPEEDYRTTKPEYEKITLIVRQNRTYMEKDPYRLIDGEIFIGEDAYWELKDTEKYDGQVFYFRNDDLKTDFKVFVQDKEFIP